MYARIFPLVRTGKKEDVFFLRLWKVNSLSLGGDPFPMIVLAASKEVAFAIANHFRNEGYRPFRLDDIEEIENAGDMLVQTAIIDYRATVRMEIDRLISDTPYFFSKIKNCLDGSTQ